MNTRVHDTVASPASSTLPRSTGHGWQVATGVLLTAVTAAVVGVILNLALWFSLRVLFADVQPVHALGLTLDMPVLRSLNAAALVLGLGAMASLFVLKLGPLKVLAACAAAGLLYRLLVP